MLTTVVLLAAGVSPREAYPAIVRGALGEGNLDYTVAPRAHARHGAGVRDPVPGLGEFNLGGDGQLALGGIAAAVVALAVPLPGGLAVAAPLAAARARRRAARRRSRRRCAPGSASRRS